MELISNPTEESSLDASSSMYPSRMVAVRGRRELGNPTSSYYGYVVDGTAKFETRSLTAIGEAGTWFAAPGPIQISAERLAVVIERFGYRCLPQVGSIEDRGRLCYIDGCSDTLLAPPARKGDPVLNLLHFPPGVRQSAHAHPSIRLGVVARGSGIAFGPASRGEWRHPLSPGTMFLLPAQEVHAFSTEESADGLTVIAYHPDSDWGPTDANHPMLNRTYLR